MTTLEIIEQNKLTFAMLIDEWSAQEVWRSVVGWPNYKISSHGRVRGPRSDLVPSLNFGYQIVSLVKDGKATNRRVHQLVLEAFVGQKPFDNAIAAHNDGDKSNNKICNLRWATNTDNQRDRERHNTRYRGSAVKHAKLKEADIPNIAARARSGENYSEIAKDYGVSISTISLIKRGKIWDHVGETK